LRKGVLEFFLNYQGVFWYLKFFIIKFFKNLSALCSLPPPPSCLHLWTGRPMKGMQQRSTVLKHFVNSSWRQVSHLEWREKKPKDLSTFFIARCNKIIKPGGYCPKKNCSFKSNYLHSLKSSLNSNNCKQLTLLLTL